jgi:hypothetical protein
MKIQISKTLFLVLCSLFLISFMETQTVAAEPQPNQFHSYLRQGIDKAFNLETASANVYIKKAVELDPENPTGYAYLAVLSLFSYERIHHIIMPEFESGCLCVWGWLKTFENKGNRLKNII